MYHNVEIGEIVSYRIWTAFRSHPLEWLCSVYSPYVWQPQINKAELESYNPVVDKIIKWPEQGGFYSFKTILQAEMFFFEQSHFNVLLGSIYNWGDVIEHEKGYRSTHAAIKSLDQIHMGRSNALDPFKVIDMYRKIYKV